MKQGWRKRDKARLAAPLREAEGSRRIAAAMRRRGGQGAGPASGPPRRALRARLPSTPWRGNPALQPQRQLVPGLGRDAELREVERPVVLVEPELLAGEAEAPREQLGVLAGAAHPRAEIGVVEPAAADLHHP